MITALEYLAAAAIVKEEKIREALQFKDSYRKIEIPKKSGGTRVTFAPHPKLGEAQRIILRRFLYRFEVDRRLHAFVPGRSHVTNAIYHACALPRYILRMDFKDAFPSVKAQHLRPILKRIILERDRLYFKALDARLKKTPVQQLRLFEPSEPSPSEKLAEEVTNILLALTTYHGRLPQGAPTSPYLLNLVVTHCGILEKIEQIIREFSAESDYFFDEDKFPWRNSTPETELQRRPRFTFYSDDLTISSWKSIPGEMIRKIARAIEDTGIFRVNWKKMAYFNRKQGVPMVTGIRVSALTREKEELEYFLREKRGFRIEELDEYVRWLMKPFNGKWEVPRVGLSKEYIRRARGLIHRAIKEKELQPVALGHISYLRSVYGNNLPKQVEVPFQQLSGSLAIAEILEG